MRGTSSTGSPGRTALGRVADITSNPQTFPSPRGDGPKEHISGSNNHCTAMAVVTDRANQTCAYFQRGRIGARPLAKEVVLDLFKAWNAGHHAAPHDLHECDRLQGPRGTERFAQHALDGTDRRIAALGVEQRFQSLR